MAESIKTGIENLLDDQLQGLLLPVESSTTNWQVLVTISLISLLILFMLWRWKLYRNTPQKINQREIQALHNSAGDNNNTQSIAIKLSSLLRQGLELNRLDDYRPEEITKWEAFLLNLDKACYSTTSPSTPDLNSLFEESQYWLNKA